MPKRDIHRLQGEIEELFADLWQVSRFSRVHSGFRPQVDCYRTEEPPGLTVVVELPGVDPDSIQIVSSERALLIAGERPRPRTDGHVYQQMEIEYGPFRRRIAFSEDVDPSAAQASYDRGFLTIVLPLAARAADPVKVSIEVHTRP